MTIFPFSLPYLCKCYLFLFRISTLTLWPEKLWLHFVRFVLVIFWVASFFLSQIHASNLSSHGPDLRRCVFTVLSSPTDPTDHWGDVGVGFGDAFECGTLRCLRTSGEVELQVAMRIFFCQTKRGVDFPDVWETSGKILNNEPKMLEMSDFL